LYETTGSILPGLAVHATINGGLLVGAPLLLYAAIRAGWRRQRQ
jgi:membrane protease YdiL (CAAX protease family)